MGSTSPHHLSAFVERLKLRSRVTPGEEQALLQPPTRVHQARTNCDFVHPGDVVEHSSFIAAGLVGRFDQNREGRRQITAVHVPGDMANLHSLVQPDATSALQALSVATILNVPHASIRAAIHQHPALAEVFWRDCVVDSTTWLKGS